MQRLLPKERHVVLVAPEVHWNTGNIGRTCLGVNAKLHLIKPLGFSLSSKQLKRAGLDYWPHVNLSVWNDLEHFFENEHPAIEEMVLLTKKGHHPYWEIPTSLRLFLFFGSETKGLPPQFLKTFNSNTYYIPIGDQIRCLNLSTTVGITLYESLRPRGT